ncbi:MULTISPECIES: hypothetical protein [unclassified Synechococcus]|uniref:hypothetical protein n=1 Tax=unclassified Synechococcus TaxID=2626047 RepID=UPI001E59D2A2|nr:MULTISPECIES: hypothetical protein [unclassified Synechococcus]WFN60337.1 hypothetical protein N4320_07250 [Synechococcus sp. CCFWC 502]
MPLAWKTDPGGGMRFNGSLEELQALVAQLGQPGHWVHQGAFEMYVLDDEETNIRLNWWPRSGDLSLVGDPAQRVDLEAALKALLA